MNSENKLVIEQLNKFGKVPQRYELLQMIERLQQENQQLKEDYDRIYNENCKLREEHNITDISLLDENYKLKDNWNKLKKFLKNTRKENLEWDKKHNCEWKGYNAYSELLIKMQEIEQGDLIEK